MYVTCYQEKWYNGKNLVGFCTIMLLLTEIVN